MTRRKALGLIPAGALAGVALTMSGCTGDAIITDLQAGLDLIAGFLPQLAAITGVPVAILTLVEDYAAAVNTALGNASTILLGTGTDAEKATLILAAFGIVAPLIPASFSAIVAIVAGLAAAVAKFLASLPPASAATPAVTVGHPAQNWTRGQREKLARATATANANTIELQALVPAVKR